VFLSEWREFPSAPCLVGRKKKLYDRSRLDFVEIARVPDELPELVSFLVRLRTCQHPVEATRDGSWLYLPMLLMSVCYVFLTS